jgi:hypothetical protein
LALLAEKSTRKKGKREANLASSATYKQDIAALERRLDSFDEFVKLWGPKLQRWDSFIEELHDAEFAKEEEEGKAATNKKDDGPPTTKEIGSRVALTEWQLEKSSSESRSDTSKSDSGSDSEDDGEDALETEAQPAKQIVQPGIGSVVLGSSEQRMTIGVDVCKKGESQKALEAEVKGKESKTKRGQTSKSGSTIIQTTEIANKTIPTVSKRKEVRTPYSVN